MRPYRPSQAAQQRSWSARQRGQNYGDHARSHSYDQGAVGSSTMRGWDHECSDANHHRRYRSDEHVAESHSEWENFGSVWYDGSQAWDTTYGHYREDRDYRSHYNNQYYDGAQQRHYTPQYNFAHNHNQHSRSYHTSVHRNDSDILFRHRRQRPPQMNIPAREPMTKRGPSNEYLKTSLEKSETVASDTKADADIKGFVRKLLVLDLNGTLVYRSPHRPWRDRHPGRSGGGAATTEEDVYAQFDPTKPRPLRIVHPRPYLTSFRNYLFHPRTKKWLDTMVWSSAQPHSVGDMVEKCFGERKEELVAIWARDRLGLDTSDYGRKVQTTKDLNKPWNELNSMPLDSSTDDSSLPPKRDHSAKTTLLLDDSPLKAHLQPYNHLCLKEYDIELRKRDMSVRELEVTRERLADVISGKQSVEDFLEKNKARDEHREPDPAAAPEIDTTKPSVDATESQEGELGTARKRKRKEKKENKKKERIEQELQKLQESSVSTYDNTLLSVIGILDAVKRETNVAAWIRSGGLIQSILNAADREPSVNSSASSAESATPIEESPRKKLKMSSKADEEGKSFGEGEGNSVSSVNSDQLPPLTSSPIRATSPPPLADEARDVDSETERTGVPVDEPWTGKDAEGEKDVQEKLWFNHPGTEEYWAERGRQVLSELEIDIVPGVVGSTG